MWRFMKYSPKSGLWHSAMHNDFYCTIDVALEVCPLDTPNEFLIYQAM